MYQSYLNRLFIVCALILVCNTEYLHAQIGRNSYFEVILHYTASAGISYVSCRMLNAGNPEMSIQNKYMISAGIGLVAGVGKEVLDLVTDNIFDFIDLGFDILGVGSGLLLHYLLFDRKTIRTIVSFNISDHYYLATIKIRF